MNKSVDKQMAKMLGASHFVAVRYRQSSNHDGQLVQWIDVVHRDFPNGPSVATMKSVIDFFWDQLDDQDLTPVVNFVAVEEDLPLEAAE